MRSIRQWVLPVPFRILNLIAFDKTRCAEVRRIFIRAVISFLCLKTRWRGIVDGRVYYPLRHAYADGTKTMIFDALVFTLSGFQSDNDQA